MVRYPPAGEKGRDVEEDPIEHICIYIYRKKDHIILRSHQIALEANTKKTTPFFVCFASLFFTLGWICAAREGFDKIHRKRDGTRTTLFVSHRACMPHIAKYWCKVCVCVCVSWHIFAIQSK